jgi:Cu(I)/Ag(I) efflux system membrane fusion protein
MELIPVSADDDADGPRQLTVSENAKALMDIEVAPVERKFVTATVRMTGKIDYDETNLAYITAWIPGRLDRLYVDYTGLPVRAGDHMVYLYSPDLISAQQELLQAIEAIKNIKETDLGIMREMTQATAKAAREKLQLWGLTSEQIAEIEKTGKVSDHMTINAPKSGIVIHKNAVEGMYVETGTRIYTIADLSKVWVKLDAYESDLEWLRYGQEVEFTTVSYPGRVFKGTISFIDPILNERTRTVKIRVNVPNTDGMLKPGMFVKASVRSQVAGGGKIMDADLAGKWICPMHPEIIKDAPGECDICQMPIVRTETLGYVSDDPALIEKPLLIPVSAALVTGTRAVVYVQVPDTEKPTYEGREIVLGPRADDYYLVREGLTEGELVVVNGNFKIDSSLQILAKPSMMTPQVEGAMHYQGPGQPTHTHRQVSEEFRAQLAGVFDKYFTIQQSLSKDDADLAIKAAKQALDALAAVDMQLLSDNTRDNWTKSAEELKDILTRSAAAEDIKSLRESFFLLSQQMAKIARHFGSSGKTPVYIIHCPMAFDNTGADWLQNHKQVDNPYFGSTMLRCGAVKETIAVKPIWQKKD